MWLLSVVIFLFPYFQPVVTISQTLSVIHNATLSTLNSNSSIINGTCSECLCLMMTNAMPFSAFNCFHHNQTCEMFSSILDPSSMVLTMDSSTSIYFNSLLSQNITSTSTTSTALLSTVTSITSIASTTSITTTTASASTTSVTTTTSTTTRTTTQSFELGTISDSSTTRNTWTSQSYLYTATSSKNVTLNFTFSTNNKCSWYLDDASVKDSAQVELLNNGYFDQSSTLVGWTSGASATCSTKYGLSGTTKVSGSYSFYHGCDKETAWVSQNFNEISGQVYNISFWFYLTCSNGAGSPDLVGINVMIS